MDQLERQLVDLEKGESAFVGKLQTRDEVLDQELDKHQQCLDQHQEDLLASEKHINTLQDRLMALEDENLTLKAQVESMADKLCHCNKGPGKNHSSWSMPRMESTILLLQKSRRMPLLKP